jgi:copper chaperone
MDPALSTNVPNRCPGKSLWKKCGRFYHDFSSDIDLSVMKERSSMETINFVAPDIECEGCAIAITNVLGGVAGIGVVTVDIDHKSVSVQFESPATAEMISNALDKAGFPPSAA